MIHPDDTARLDAAAHAARSITASLSGATTWARGARVADTRGPGELPEIVDWSEFWLMDDPADDWLVEPLIARGRAHSLYAPAKAGKSLLALGLAAAAAAGRPWLDHRRSAPVRVLYLDYEMSLSDVRERLSDMGYSADDDLSSLMYVSIPALNPLDTAAGGDDVVGLAERYGADLVIIDTLSRTLAGEENSADTIRGLSRHTILPLKAMGVATLRIDHSGKDLERGQRGSSAKVDDVDVVWQLVPRDAARFTLRATHKRIQWVPDAVELCQTHDPLGYAVATDSWPAGTAEAATMLDRAGVPIDASRRLAVTMLKAANMPTGRNEALSAALRWRRNEAERHAVISDEPEP